MKYKECRHAIWTTTDRIKMSVSGRSSGSQIREIIFRELKKSLNHVQKRHFNVFKRWRHLSTIQNWGALRTRLINISDIYKIQNRPANRPKLRRSMAALETNYPSRRIIRQTDNSFKCKSEDEFWQIFCLHSAISKHRHARRAGVIFFWWIKSLWR